MNILLTGADGFTGVHFAQQASLNGHTIFTLKANLLDSKALSHEIAAIGNENAIDAVVHLAAISFVGHADLTAFYAVNVLGTSYLLDALLQLPINQRPRSVLVASSANIYGNCTHSPIVETQPPAPVNHYAASKLAMEHIALTYAEQLPLFIVRPFNYTGVGQAASFLIPKLVHHFAQRKTEIELGNLHVEREFNDVRMVVQSYLALLQHAQTAHIYNICTEQPYALLQVIEKLEKITQHSPKIRVNPAFVRANEVHRLCGSADKLRRTIGVLPAFTLEQTLTWMLENID